MGNQILERLFRLAGVLSAPYIWIRLYGDTSWGRQGEGQLESRRSKADRPEGRSMGTRPLWQQLIDSVLRFRPYKHSPFVHLHCNQLEGMYASGVYWVVGQVNCKERGRKGS